MSWRNLFKPQDKDPKNIVEWLGLITDDIKKLKNTDNWYDEVSVITEQSIIDNLTTDVGEFALSARQGHLLNKKIGVSDQKISVLEEDVTQLQLDMTEVNNKISDIKNTGISLINENIEEINNKLEQHKQTLDSHGADITKNKNDIDGLTTRITKNESDINTLDNRVSENENNITRLGERTSTSENNINNINTNIDEIEDDITDLRNIINKNVTISNTRIDSLVGDNVKISGLEVKINNDNTQLTVSPGKAIIQGKIIEVKSNILTAIDQALLTRNIILYTLISLDVTTNNVVVSLSETDMDGSSLRIHSMIINNGSIIESLNNSNMIPVGSLIGVSADKEAANIREQIPSGFKTLGELDYSYMRNNENQVKFKTKSVAYINGYKIEIPAGVKVNIGRAPEKDPREDLLFLEAWKDIDFNKTGKLKWRIRHVKDIDFNKVWAQANEGPDKYIGLNSNGSEFAKIIPQGGRLEPIVHCSWNKVYQNRYTLSYNTKEGMINPTSGDAGLWSFLIGGNEIESFKNEFKTIDGFCYAIPMFRLYRRPSCGKLEPYEYDKINKLCDYDKVKSLVTSEKVEKVISETINGKTLLNHCTPMRKLDKSGVASSTITVIDNEVTIKTTTPGSLFIKTKELTTIKPQTEYTILIADVMSSIDVDVFIGDKIGNNSFGNTYIASNTKLIPNNINKIKFRTGDNVNDYYIWIGLTSNDVTKVTISIKGMMILEGDWTKNVYLPNYFEGLSSLGDEEYNLIKVKNGIIHYPTYNPITGKQKLKVQDSVTHIISENIIKPEINADVKRGEQTSSVISQFGKIQTNGDEIIEFTKIKGKTVRNLVSAKANWAKEYDRIEMVLNNPLLKENVKYTFINKSNKNIIVHNYLTIVSGHVINGSVIPYTIAPGSRYVFTARNLESNNAVGRKIFLLGLPTNQWTADNVEYFKKSIILLEGDHTIKPLKEIPYIEGIQSVGENEKSIISIKSCGKNLFDGKLQRGYWYNGSLNHSDYSVANINNILIKQNTTYTFNIENYNDNIYIAELNELLDEIKSYQIRSGSSITTSSGKYIRFCTDKSVSTALDLNVNIQIEEGTSSTTFQPYKEYKQEIHLKEPLRSLPGGICDEIIGNKIIRRVGKKDILYNSNVIGKVPANSTSTHTQFNITISDTEDIKTSDTGICNNFILDRYVAAYGVNFEGFSLYYKGVIVFRILKNKLTTDDENGFATWLSQNPTTIYYELKTPVEEYIENVYDKESIKTYQLDAPLRSLPNGVRDEIKDGVLIRRCGEIILDGSSDEGWNTHGQDTDKTLHFQSGNLLFSKVSSKSDIFVDNFKVNLIGAWAKDDVEGLTIGKTGTRGFDIRVNKTRLNNKHSVDGLRAWLNNNPIKVIYELLTPIYTKLNEVHNNKTDYSFNRQFKDGNWLRVLPNGVKDSIENGKVIRRTDKIILNGTENWQRYDNGIVDTDNTMLFVMYTDKLNIRKATNQYGYMSNLFKTHNGIHAIDEEYLYMHENQTYNNHLYIRINKSKLTKLNETGLKEWLSKNHMIIYYELLSSKQENPDNTNYTYHPQHDIFNTSCASLYVTDGYNNIDILNNIKSFDNVIETSYRDIKGNKDVVDTHYKPSIDGKKISYNIPKGKNKINMFDYTMNEDINKVMVYRNEQKIVVSTIEQSKISFPLRWFIRLNPNTTYTISSVIESTNINNYRFHVYNYSEDTQITSSNYTLNSLTGISSTKVSSSFKTSDNGAVVVTFLIATDSTTGNYAPNIPFNISNLQIEEGDIKTEYEEFISDVRAFENVESNNVSDLRKNVSLTGYNYEQMLNKSFDLLLNGEL